VGLRDPRQHITQQFSQRGIAYGHREGCADASCRCSRKLTMMFLNLCGAKLIA